MFQNIKTDIIYYKTNTDFEMEFNLCGCCRMRLLTDKSSDRKNLIGNLSRAVSRSRIIMVVGALFGEEGIINVVSNAIGKGVATVDNNAYGINSSEEIEIIDGSTPLVTQEGIFGGCIIESGPQTMILVSDSKNIRKSIMNSLIHPYIEELYAGELTANSASAEESEEPEEQEIEQENTCETEETVEEETIENTESQSEEVVSEETNEEESVLEENVLEDEPNEDETETETSEIPLVMEEEVEVSGGMVFETDEEVIKPQPEETFELFAEAKKIRKKEAKYYNEAYGDFELDDAGLVADDDGEQFYNPNPSLNVAMTIIVAIILVLLAILCFCIFYVPTKEGISASEFVKSIFETLFG